MKMYEVKYKYISHNGIEREEIDQMTEDRVTNIRRMIEKKDYYTELEFLKDLGEKDETWIPAWLKIGKNNPWIREANDPPFEKRMFAECKTIEYLIEQLKHGNWCLGQAFYYKDLCFINQVDGGDEWLTSRRDIDFESASCGYMIKKHGEEYMEAWIEDCLNATDEQLKKLEYTNLSNKFERN